MDKSSDLEFVGDNGPQGTTGVVGQKGAKGNQMSGGYFETIKIWCNLGYQDQLQFKPHGWSSGDPVYVLEMYLSGSGDY